MLATIAALLACAPAAAASDACSGAALYFNASAAAGAPLGTAARRLQTALADAAGLSTVHSGELSQLDSAAPIIMPAACVEFALASSPSDLALLGESTGGPYAPEEFRVRVVAPAPAATTSRVLILAADQRGALYGAQAVIDRLAKGGTTGYGGTDTLQALADLSVQPRFPVRGIKFDLPWSPYGLSVSLSVSLCLSLSLSVSLCLSPCPLRI
jgi:hypothetical protein